MNIKWDELKNFEDWAQQLDELLDMAVQAVKNNDINERVEVQKTLRQFKRKSPNVFSHKLDVIASQAIKDIFLETLTQCIKALSSRSEELDSYVKDIRSVTSETAKVTLLINLETPKTVASSLNEVINAIKDIKKALKDDSKADEIAKHVDTTIAGIKKLRKTIVGSS